MAVEVTSLVWQVVEATAYKAYKICHVVGLLYSLRFLQQTGNGPIRRDI